MQKEKQFNLKASIVKGLRKDPEKLLSELSKASGAATTTQLKSNLDSISILLNSEAIKQDERKALSRKIGPAKKNNEDCSALIEQVSQLSSDINSLNEQIKLQVSEIESLVESANDSNTAPVSRLPQHLIHHDNGTDAIPDGYTVSHTQTADSVEWQNFVAACPHATIYHDLRWQEIIENNFGHKLHQIVSRDPHGNFAGIMPLIHLQSRVFGSFSISVPYFNYGGPLASNPVVEQQLLTYGARMSEELGCSHMEVRETHARENWKAVQRKVSMILPLPESDDQLDADLGSKIRAQVNKAASNDLSIKFGGPDLVDHFYHVFSRNMRDLGTPVYGKKLFSDIVAAFPNEAFIAVVYRNNRPLAAGFLLGFRDKLEIPWASSLRSQNHLGANMFMYRSILREAINRQYQFFDFGRSTKEASTYKFKKQWGAIEHALHWHYWTRDDNDLPEINPDNPKYKLVIRAWQMLPVFVTRIIGPLISKNLP